MTEADMNRQDASGTSASALDALRQEVSRLVSRITRLEEKISDLERREQEKDGVVSDLQGTINKALLELARATISQKDALMKALDNSDKNRLAIEELRRQRQHDSGKHRLDDRATRMQEIVKMLLPVLKEKFSVEELNSLMVDLGVKPEDVPGTTRATRAEEFVAHMIRRDRLIDLAIAARKLRPRANLPVITGDDYV